MNFSLSQLSKSKGKNKYLQNYSLNSRNTSNNSYKVEEPEGFSSNSNCLEYIFLNQMYNETRNVCNNYIGNNITLNSSESSYTRGKLGRKRFKKLDGFNFNPPYENHQIRLNNLESDNMLQSIMNSIPFLCESVFNENNVNIFDKDDLNMLPNKRITKEDYSLIKNKCSICFDDYIVEDIVLTLPCLHIFHDLCFGKWFRYNCSCPICKFKIDTSILSK